MRLTHFRNYFVTLVLGASDLFACSFVDLTFQITIMERESKYLIVTQW